MHTAIDMGVGVNSRAGKADAIRAVRGFRGGWKKMATFRKWDLFRRNVHGLNVSANSSR